MINKKLKPRCNTYYRIRTRWMGTVEFSSSGYVCKEWCQPCQI